MAGFPYRPPSVSVISGAVDSAKGPQESLYPGLWRNHIGTIAPCIMGTSSIVPEFAHRGDHWDTLAPVPLVNSPIGPAFNFNPPAATSRVLKHDSGASDASMYKFDVPFTIAFYVNCHTFSGVDLVIFFVSDRRAGFQNFAGIHIFRSTDNEIAISVADNTSQEMFGVDGMALWQTDNSFITVDKWTYIVVVVRSFALPDEAKTVGIDFWQNGQMENWDDVSEGQGSQTMVHANSARKSNIGWLKPAGQIDQVSEAYSLALWQCWTRALSDWEIRTLSADPLAMFRRRRRTVGKVSIFIEDVNVDWNPTLDNQGFERALYQGFQAENLFDDVLQSYEIQEPDHFPIRLSEEDYLVSVEPKAYDEAALLDWTPIMEDIHFEKRLLEEDERLSFDATGPLGNVSEVFQDIFETNESPVGPGSLAAMGHYIGTYEKTTDTFSPVANRVYYMPLFIPFVMRIREMGIYLTVGDVTKKMRIGIYNFNRGIILEKIYDNQVGLDSQFYTRIESSVYLSPGAYCVAFVSESSGITVWKNNVVNSSLANITPDGFINLPNHFYENITYSDGLPNPAGTTILSDDDSPRIIVRLG